MIVEPYSQAAPDPVREARALDQVRDWLSARSGICFSQQKDALLHQRLSRVMRSFAYSSVEALARAMFIEARTDVQLAVMHAASTNHTYFFREPEVLQSFVNTVLPAIAHQRPMRIWSAAASTGDEAYTIAILIAEKLGLDALERLQILGTDISAPVVERAELGVFPARQFTQTSPALLQRYFTPTGIEQYQVRDAIRATCTFRRMNLKARSYPFTKPFHAVFCRNILYYFDRADQLATLEAIHDATEPGGWLITSVTESIRDLGSRWQPVATGIYRKVHP
jgi:chemotaxis protein methyltransferase CheR